MLSKEIDESATLLLQELVRFQERVYQKDPTKAKSKRRLVMGLREVTKHMKLHNIKCVIISPNCEKVQAKGEECCGAGCLHPCSIRSDGETLCEASAVLSPGRAAPGDAALCFFSCSLPSFTVETHTLKAGDHSDVSHKSWQRSRDHKGVKSHARVEGNDDLVIEANSQWLKITVIHKSKVLISSLVFQSFLIL